MIADALRLWPLALVAIGLGLVLRRTHFSVPGGMLAAAVPGLVLGGAFVVTPNLAMICGPDRVPTSVATSRHLRWAGRHLRDGRLRPRRHQDRARKRMAARRQQRRPTARPTIEASARTLSIEAGGGRGWRAFRSGGEEWHLTLPTTAIDELSVEVNAGEGRIGLPGAQIGTLDVHHERRPDDRRPVGDVRRDPVGRINAGRLSVNLPAGADIVGSLEVNAGELQVCTPAGVGLRVRHDGALNGISINGQHRIRRGLAEPGLRVGGPPRRPDRRP